jgi:hypothetical protein
MTELSNELLKNCKMLANRYYILEHIPKNGIGAEIGVLGGDWSKHLLNACLPQELNLIDTFYSNDYPSQKRFSKSSHETYIRTEFSEYGEKVKILKGLSWDILKNIPNNYFDWIYIDAAHDYKSVKKDLKEAYRTLKPEGYIIMNDYIMYDHFTKEDYGVVQATNEFMIEHNFEMLYFALHPNMFCDVVIKKIEK